MAPTASSTLKENSSSSLKSFEQTKEFVPDFEWSYTEEPHLSRRKLILAAHPEIRSLFGPDPKFKYVVVLSVLSQVFFAWLVSDLPWLYVILMAYSLGGLINHSLTLAMHEVSHNLAFLRPDVNRIFGIFTNLPLGIPSSISFRRYHMEHHQYQGEDGIDADIPTLAEGAIFTNSLSKILWCFLQPAFYALRPVIVMPKVPTKWEAYNLIAQLAFDFAIFYFFSLKSLIYLLVGTLLGMGIHPMAGHFIAEHYTFIRGQETYSYYGPLNWFSYNVGYHNEHHDFPYVPGSRLGKVRAMAPEFYDQLPHHDSWVRVIYRYIVDSSMGPFARVKRTAISEETRAFIAATSKAGAEKCST